MIPVARMIVARDLAHRGPATFSTIVTRTQLPRETARNALAQLRKLGRVELTDHPAYGDLWRILPAPDDQPLVDDLLAEQARAEAIALDQYRVHRATDRDAARRLAAVLARTVKRLEGDT